MKTLNFIGLFLLMAGAIQCCKDEPPDPCKDAKPITADFTINELVSSPDHDWMPDTSFETDTAYWVSMVEFRPKNMNYESYEWHIGSEVLHDKIIRRSDYPPNRQISVTLIVKSKPNNQCFPKDDGIDTVTKTFFSLGTVANNPKIGKWFGTYNGKSMDTGTVEIRYVYDGKRDTYNFFLINFPKGHLPKATLPSNGKGELGYGGATSFINNDFTFIDDTSGVHNGNVIGYIDGENMLKIKLRETKLIDFKPTYSYKFTTFSGYKKK